MRMAHSKVGSMILALGLCVVSSETGFSTRNHNTYDNIRALSNHVGFHIGEGENIKCGLPTVAAAWNRRDSLGADMKEQLDNILQRPSLQKSVVIGFFRIHYDTVGGNTPSLLDENQNPVPETYDAYADSVGAIANYVLSFETGELGYLQPPTDNGAGGGNEYDIYISNLTSSGSGIYGSVDWETPIVSKPNGGTWTTFMNIDNDFTFVFPRTNRGLPALRVTLAHEFHHAIQIGRYGLWFGHEYFYEITSTWLEDVLYTDVNDYYNYLPAHFTRPTESFTKADQSIEYSRCLWGNFVAKRFGRDAMRRAWEEIQSDIPLRAMDNALQIYQSTFRQAFAEWTLWNYFTGSRSDSLQYYPEGSHYPYVSQVPVDFNPPSRTLVGWVNTLGSRYHQVLAANDTLILILPNVNFTAGLAGDMSAYNYTLLLSNQALDESYRPTPVGVYFKLDVADPTNWSSPWAIVRGGVIPSTIPPGIPFPNPFFADGRANLYIPVNISGPTQGQLSILTSSMDLVFSQTIDPVTPRPGQQAFAWNGRTNKGNIVQTGVYFFVLEVQGQTLNGKIAVVRK